MKTVAIAAASSLLVGTFAQQSSAMSSVLDLLKSKIATEKQELADEENILKQWRCFFKKEDPAVKGKISELQASLQDATTERQAKLAEATKLGFEIENLVKGVNDATIDLTLLTSACQKAAEEAAVEQTELSDAVNRLNNAISELAGQTDDGTDNAAARIENLNKVVADAEKVASNFFLRKKATALIQQKSLLSKKGNTNVDEAGRVITIFPQLQEQRRRLSALLPAGPHQAQSGEVVGILKNMYDSMTLELSQNQDQANKTSASCAEQSNLLTTKIIELTALNTTTSEAKGQALERVAFLEGEIQTTTESLAATEAQLVSLTENNEEQETKFRWRTQMHNTQVTAMTTALEILNDDSSFELWSKYKGAASLAQIDLRRSVNAMNNASSRKAQSLLQLDGPAPLPTSVKLICSVEKAKSDLDAEEEADTVWKRECDDLRNATNAKIVELTSSIEFGEAEKLAMEGRLQAAQGLLNTSRADYLLYQTIIKTLQKTRDTEYATFVEESGNMNQAVTLLTKALQVLQSASEYLSKRGAAHSYEKLADTDLSGPILESHPGKTVEELEAICTEIGPACGGFTKSGDLKNADNLGDKVAVQGQEVYVKTYSGEVNPTLVKESSYAEQSVNGYNFNPSGQVELAQQAPPVATATVAPVDTSGTANVIALLESIKANFETSLNQTATDETEAVTSFNLDIANSTAALNFAEAGINEAQLNIANLDESLATNAAELASFRQLKADAEAFLESKKETCDFIDTNLELRRGQRDQDRQAYEQAIAAVVTTPGFSLAKVNGFSSCNGKDSCSQEDLDRVELSFACQRPCGCPEGSQSVNDCESRCAGACQQCVFNEVNKGSNIGLVEYCQQHAELLGCAEILSKHGVTAGQSNW